MNYYRDLLINFENAREKLQNACFQVHVCNEVLIARKTGQSTSYSNQCTSTPVIYSWELKKKKEHAFYYDNAHNDNGWRRLFIQL